MRSACRARRKGVVVVLLAIGVVQLVVNLTRAVIDVNRRGAAADTSEWETRKKERRG